MFAHLIKNHINDFSLRVFTYVLIIQVLCVIIITFVIFLALFHFDPNDYPL